jgi:hypothetical protein
MREIKIEMDELEYKAKLVQKGDMTWTEFIDSFDQLMNSDSYKRRMINEQFDVFVAKVPSRHGLWNAMRVIAVHSLRMNDLEIDALTDKLVKVMSTHDLSEKELDKSGK